MRYIVVMVIGEGGGVFYGTRECIFSFRLRCRRGGNESEIAIVSSMEVKVASDLPR